MPTNNDFPFTAVRVLGYLVTPANWNGAMSGLNRVRAGELAIADQAAHDLIIATGAAQLGRLATPGAGQVLTSGAPAAWSATLPTGVQDAITRTGTVTSGTWGAAFSNNVVVTAAIANSQVTLAKIQDVSGFSILGKHTSGSGAPTNFAVADQSVVGRTTGNLTSLEAGDNGVLRRAGSGGLGFGTLVTANLGDSIVTLAKIQDVSGFSILGKHTSGSGAPTNFSVSEQGVVGRTSGNIFTLTASDNQVLRRSGSGNLGFGTLVAGNIGSGQVTLEKLADVASGTVLGRSAGGSGAVSALSTLPAVNGSAVTNLSAAALASGTVPDARFPATLPALNGSALTSLNATAITSGTLAAARLPGAGSSVNWNIGVTQSLILNPIQQILIYRFQDGASGAVWRGTKMRGTPESPAPPQSGDALSHFSGTGWADGAIVQNSRGSYVVVAAEEWTAEGQGTHLDLQTTNVGSTTTLSRWRVQAPGHLVPHSNTYQLGSSGTRINRVYATDFDGGGADLTGLSASALATGTLPMDRIGSNAITYSKLQQASAGFTILAKPTTGAGTYSELAAASDEVLRRNGSGNLAFGAIVTGNIGDGQVTLAKLANVASGTVLGRSAGGSGAVSALATLPAVNGAAVTDLNASALASGTVPDARFPATLPALNGSALTNLNASALATGTIPDGRFPATLPAASGSNLTSLNASQLATGTLPMDRIATNAITYSKLQQASAGFTILAKPTTGAGTYSELAAASDEVLRRNGSGNLAFGALVTGNIGDSQVTLAKLANVASGTVLGRSAGGSGAVSALSTLPAVNGAAVTDLNASALASGTVPDARFPATLPALNGSALTNLNASALATGTVAIGRFPAGTQAWTVDALTLSGSLAVAGAFTTGPLGAAYAGSGYQLMTLAEVIQDIHQRLQAVE